MRRPRFTVPSGGRARRRDVRLLALLAVRDDLRFLPGYLESLGPQVDGIVALDDGSTDGSAELLERAPEVLEVVRIPADRPVWDEPGNYRRLVAAALDHAPDWLVSVDADERVEHAFRDRAERVIRRGGRLGFTGYALRLRELWGGEGTYRADGVWATKMVARLFAARPGAPLDPAALHADKVPPAARRLGRVPLADLELYHLRMLQPDDRAARRQRYEQADPDARWQPGLGYAYLTEERGLRLRRVPPARDHRARR